MMVHLRNDTEVLPHRPDRCAMETHRTVRPTRQAGRPSAGARHARHSGCDLLSHTHRMRLANAAARLSTLENGLRVLQSVARRRHLGNNECAVARTGPTESGTTCRTANRGHRQPICENDRSRRRTRLRRGKKRSTAASGTCSLTRWAWCCAASSTRRTCRTVTGPSGCSPRRRSTSSDCASFASIAHTLDNWSSGFDRCAAGRWRSSVELPEASWCSPNAGWWSELSRGFTSTADSLRITNICRNRANRIFTSP